MEKAKIVPKVWGREIIVENNDKYCHKKLILNEGYTSSYHFHKKKDETFYVESGKVALELEGRMILLDAFDKIRILPGQKHRFVGLKNSVMTEVSTPHRDEDSYRMDGRLSGKVYDEEMNKIKEALGINVPLALFNR